MKAYLDIETSFNGEITIIGIFCPPERLVQLVGEEVNWTNLWNALEGVTSITTYNGNRFDLPMIRRSVKLDLPKYFACRDLMYSCWERNLFGGLKRVEEQVGIERLSKGINGLDAMRLWQESLYGDESALRTLLEYNREDVVNLWSLEIRLEEMSPVTERAGRSR